ncbi:MAG: trypsin-like peptidase domain-containing protein [Patescibacteria group bacterium]|nr:trypsin-like peptidase domain-containing protein [Patescibacteria group bacterium]
MENSNLDLKKIKEMFKDPVVRTVVVSFLTIVITLGIAAGFAWYYRAQIFKLLAGQNNMNPKPVTPAVVIGDNSKLNSAPVTPSTPVAPPPAPVQEEDTVVSAVKKAKPAVVSILISKEVPKYDVSYNNQSVTDPSGNPLPGVFLQTPVYKQVGTELQQIGSGSGFLISSDGLIVTNRHVVEDKTAIYNVLLNNGKKYTATVLARDGVLDVALIKINATGLPYLDLANSDTLDVGQSVIAIGNALGQFENTVSVGVVSGLSRSIVAGDTFGQSEILDKVIQTDAAINPGNSGGPLLNLKGQVVGINVAVVQGSSNVGFALPINSVKSAINSVIKTGKIIRPYIGVRYVKITPELKVQDNLSVDYGILIEKGQTAADLAVIPGSPADKAGIVENDIILSVDGIKIDQNQDFSSYIRNKKVGDIVTLEVLSKGVKRTVTLALQAAPDNL